MPLFFGLNSNLDRNFCILHSKLDSKLNYEFDFKLDPKSYSKLDSKFRF